VLGFFVGMGGSRSRFFVAGLDSLCKRVDYRLGAWENHASQVASFFVVQIYELEHSVHQKW